MPVVHTGRADPSRIGLYLLMAVSVMACGQAPSARSFAPNPAIVETSSSFMDHSDEAARDDLDNCRVHRVTGLPGSHQFASDFIESIATDPSGADDSDVIWGLTADLSTKVPFQQRAMYISKSSDGGATWNQVARVGSRYFDAKIGEGLRNGLVVSPGGAYFVITTQRGAFQVIPQSRTSEAVIRAIPGPHVPYSPPKMPIPKKAGDPVRANVAGMMADGKHMIIGYGYFDREPELFRYHRDKNGSWVEDGPLPRFPTEMDILSMQFDNPKNPHPRYVYVGTGDQVYLLNLRTMEWSRIEGVGPDSAIHGMSVVGGLHLAACWGVYNPAGPGMVKRAVNARFLLHRYSDEAGPNIRAYSIEVDPLRPNREVVTSITGVYTSQDGEDWRRLNDLPEGEYRSAHFSSNGAILVSGMPGTFLVNPFSKSCQPQLKIREKSKRK
jgi:hypothetical protein